MAITVATDLSARSDYAVARATMLADQMKTSAVALHAIDGNLPGSYRDHAVEWAESTWSSTGSKLPLSVKQGVPADVIMGAANGDDCDLLVYGVHGADDADRNKARAFRWTTAGRSIAGTMTPTLLVTGAADAAYRRVVVGIDFSVFSQLALDQARVIAPDAMLHLVHAFHPPFTGLAGADLAEDVAYQRQLEIDAFIKGQLADLTETVGDEVSSHIVAGDPADALRQVCHQQQADLLVIATHGRGTFSRAIWGSVAEDILNAPPCDVLVIKPISA
ncbi:MAG: universal stress protein [Alphaproteobacteria bacterium]|nr:universal stress protein [Alphaproteobacteria bacterium SS10]